MVHMCLAEAVLRIPDDETADRLIRDKIAAADWESHLGHSGPLFVNASTWALALLWGIAVVADSAQFSSCIVELSDRAPVGTMLTVQTCVGFLLTLVTVHMMPPLVAWVDWRYAIVPLAIGPFLGVLAMSRLRDHPDAVKLASGNR